MPAAAPRMCAAFESTDKPATPLVGSSTAEPSASTDRKPPRPRSSPRAPSTMGAGIAPWKLDGTWLWLAESGLGSDALMAFTRAVIVRWPIPPSDPEVPSTGFPPLTIMPASGWNARIASTAVLHASVAGWEAGMLHCGSWAARDAASDKRATIVVVILLNECICPPPHVFPSTLCEAHASRPGSHFTDQPGLDLDASRRRRDRFQVVAAGNRDHADAEVEHAAHFAQGDAAGPH